MKGDFTRDTFDKDKQFSRVLMQQGRVQLDADWNEQVSILLHYLRTLAADLIGPYGGPGEGFAIRVLEDSDGQSISHNFVIGQGHYYVDGILCENLLDRTYQHRPNTEPPYPSQPNYPLPDNTPLAEEHHLVYLDVWERHISYLEDEDEHGDEPSIREVALRGPDTASRAKVVWQVKLQEGINACPSEEGWQALLEKWQSVNRGLLRARAKAPGDAGDEDPCVTPPEARYRGTENQLYRVEVHRGGAAWDGTAGTRSTAATFKWSRDNGTAVYPIRHVEGKEIVLETLGRDDRFTLQEGDWVEIGDDDYVLLGGVESLLEIESIDRAENKVTVKGTPAAGVGRDPAKHPLLRRWDHRAGDPAKNGLELDDSGAALLREVSAEQEDEEQEGEWLLLENGVCIQFQEQDQPNEYRSGDYWLIPARTATGDVEWPGTVEDPQPLPPHGIEHHYAPLAIINVTGGTVTVQAPECRRTIQPLPGLTP